MKNNIDKIFNESLQNYERQPRTEAWEKLQARLEQKDRKILPLWWKYASAASIALLLGVGGYWFANKDVDSTEQMAVIKKPVIEKNTASINPKEDTVELSSNIDRPVASPPVAGVPTSPHVRKQQQDFTTKKLFVVKEKHNEENFGVTLPNEKEQVQPIVAKTNIPEIKKQTEENTIVLVLEDTKPKVEEETIVLNFVETKPEVVAQNTEPEKKQSRVGKIWEQLKRAKNGEDVDWNRLGVKPQKVLARADAKIENVLSKGESEK